MKELRDALKPLKRTLTAERAFNWFLIGLAIGLAVNVLLAIVGKFTYIHDITPWRLGVAIISPLIGIVASAVYRPDFIEVCRVGDALGFQERFSTAFELMVKKDESPLLPLLVQDAVGKARAADFRNLYKVRLPKRKLSLCGVMMVVLMLSGFISAPGAEEFQEKAQAKAAIAEEIKKIEEQAAEAVKDLTDKDARDMNARLKQLLNQAKKSETTSEAVKEFQKAQQELKRASQNSVSKDLKKLGEALQTNSTTQALGEKIAKGDVDGLSREIQSLTEALKNLTPEQLQQLSEMLAKAAESLSGDEELIENLSQLSDVLTKGDFANLSQSMAGFEKRLEEISAENAQFREALDKISDAMAASSRELTGQSGQGNQSGQTGQQNQGSQPGQTRQQNQGNQSGQDGQQGQGSQSGQTGQPGQGNQLGQDGQQGQGDQPGQDGQSGANGQSTDSGRGQGSIESENIYSRPAQHKGEYETNISGIENESGETQKQIQQGLGQAGQTRPYSEVVGSYKSEALNNLDDYEIPIGMKEIVKEYFSTLE